jgi:hypothetical protein
MPPGYLSSTPVHNARAWFSFRLDALLTELYGTDPHARFQRTDVSPHLTGEVVPWTSVVLRGGVRRHGHLRLFHTSSGANEPSRCSTNSSPVRMQNQAPCSAILPAATGWAIHGKLIRLAREILITSPSAHS